MPKAVIESVMLKKIMHAKSKFSIHFFSSSSGLFVIGDIPRTMKANIFKPTRNMIKIVFTFYCVVNCLPSFASLAFFIKKKNLKILRKRIAMPTNIPFL
jgi:hypothetical protein